MSAPALSQLDRDVIESVLQMGGGYVLDFSDRTFAEFFQDFGVRIDDDMYRTQGSSKANRLRTFLRMCTPALAGQVLVALLERRLLIQANRAYRTRGEPDRGARASQLREHEVQRYRAVLSRLGVTPSEPAQPTGKKSTSEEASLLQRVLNPDALARLPLSPSLIKVLADRMEEAGTCIRNEAFLAAVILCGSVLEGLCLGIGERDPERVNRAYLAKFKRTAPRFDAWKLREWIDVLGSLGDLSPNVAKFGQALREFRNYVHPADQLTHQFSPDRHTARIGFQVVVAAIDDLARATSGGAA